MTVFRLLAVAAAAAVVLPVAAMAQDGEVKFWMKGDAKNLQGCIAADPQLTREHTFTLKDGKATLKSPGGINTDLKLVKPNVYQETIALGRVNLVVVADLGATPKKLTMTDANMGCSWTAVKE
jgi:hypothetical protein